MTAELGELVAAQVSVSFGSFTALTDVDLRVRPGDLVALTGSSGAGKTTLLSVLAGLRRPSGGTVTLAGARLADRDGAVAGGIVLIPQGNSLVGIFTALENVLVPLVRDARRTLDPADRDDRSERALRALTAVGLDEAAGQLMDELSGGQQQRVAVARGLAERGAVVLADEPTSELDAASRARVLELLRAEASRGAAVVVATHDSDAAALADAELHLDSGHGQWRRDDRR